MLVDGTLAKLVGDRFHWSPERDGFVVESNEAIRLFNMEEIGLLKRLEDSGYLKRLGAFGFIIARSHEDQFFSKTDIEAVRPCEKESKEFFAIATMLNYAVEKIIKDTNGILLADKVDNCIEFIKETTEDLPERRQILSKLAMLQNDQGTKFSIQAKGIPAMLDFIAEVVNGKFRLWTSWSPLEMSAANEDESMPNAVRLVVGHAIMANCLDKISFVPRTVDSTDSE